MPSNPAVRTDIVFVFDNLPNWQQLAAGVREGAQVVVLDGAHDGLAQMADYLKGRSGIDAVHIISHGAQGQVHLGSLALDQAGLAQNAAALAAIGRSLNADGDILLYGCDVGRGDSGATLLASIAKATGADVAASDDRTGASARGGDGVLEASVGTVTAEAAVQPCRRRDGRRLAACWRRASRSAACR